MAMTVRFIDSSSASSRSAARTPDPVGWSDGQELPDAETPPEHGPRGVRMQCLYSKLQKLSQGQAEVQEDQAWGQEAAGAWASRFDELWESTYPAQAVLNADVAPRGHMGPPQPPMWEIMSNEAVLFQAEVAPMTEHSGPPQPPMWETRSKQALLAVPAPPGLPGLASQPRPRFRPPPGLSLCPFGAASGGALAGAAPPGAAAPGGRGRKVVSVGTVGHPQSCKEPCTQEPCLEGAACRKCHLCKVPSEAAPEAGGEGEDCPSVGSMGHPFSCALACKFHHKRQECKDGKLCVRCHMCTWRRFMAPQRRARQL